MYILKRELISQKLSILIWGIAIGALTAVAVIVYPQMQSQMDNLNEMMSSMGGLTKAFGMDQLNFQTITGYYAIECGNMLGLGGAFFSAIIAVSSLMKEERDRTAEFLLTHPVSRVRVITEKLLSVFISILIVNAIVLAFSAVALLIAGSEINWGTILLFHLAYLILQFEIAGICFGISAIINKFGLGLGIGITAVFYFMNIISNLTAKAKFLKYITPYGYTDGAMITNSHQIEMKYLLPGILFFTAGIVLAYLVYTKKDIQS